MSNSRQRTGLVFTYNNKPKADNNKPKADNNMPMPMPKAMPMPIAKANYMPMNRLINMTNSGNPTSMRSIIHIPAGSCSSCGN